MKSLVKAFLLPFLVFAGCVVASAAMVLVSYDWSGWKPASCILHHRCFCEGIGTGFVRQWANTYSNLAFVFVGLWVWGIVRQDRQRRQTDGTPPANLLAASPMLSGLYVLIVVSLGLMSMLYHASLTFVGQWFDIQAMYLITTFLVLYNLARIDALPPRFFVGLYLASNVLLGLFQIYLPDWRRFAFGGLLGLVCVTVWLDRARHKRKMQAGWLVAGAISLAVAFGIWQLDINKIVCDPRSWLQGHAVWHTLCALSTGLIFMYYRSEVAVSEETHVG